MAIRTFISWKTMLVVLLWGTINVVNAAQTSTSAPIMAGTIVGSYLGAFIIVYAVWWLAYVWYPSEKVQCPQCQETHDNSRIDYCPNCGSGISNSVA